jgi:hypothetical protein
MRVTLNANELADDLLAYHAPKADGKTQGLLNFLQHSPKNG